MFKFYGAKQRLASRYPAPTYLTIIEPFAGAAGYAVHHRNAAGRVILVEKDERVVELWRRLLVMDTAELAATPAPIPGERCTDLLVAFAAGRTTRDTPHEFTVTSRMAERFDPMRRRICAVLDECRHFEVVHGDYRDAPDVDATWFIDPPYQPTGKGRPDRTRGGRYAHSNLDLDYTELGEWTRARRGQVIACDQDGADWLPWNGSVAGQDASSRAYREVFWHRAYNHVKEEEEPMSIPESADENPVVIYDVMREAATRLRGELVAAQRFDDARRVADEVKAVDPLDMDAQRSATARFEAERQSLIHE